jgi:2-isopropylmalate synthase
VLSVHCHNDLGQAVANSLTAVMNGARQVECTINGIGERAGNASLEEVVMALRTRKDFFGVETGVKTEEIFRTSRLLSHITGIHVQPNKAIVGENAFAHEAGIHQDGMLKERRTYEIMRPEDVGLSKTDLVLGKHSGRAALADRAKALGYHLTGEQLQSVFEEFKVLADKKKEIYDGDIAALRAGGRSAREGAMRGRPAR